VAASAVECRSVTVEQDLDTVEVAGSSPVVPTIYLGGIEPRKLRFQRVRPDQALAPGRQVVQDRLVAPLWVGAMDLGVGATRIAW